MAPNKSSGQSAHMSGPNLNSRTSDFSSTAGQNGIDGGTQPSKPFGSTLAATNGWVGSSIWGNNTTLTSNLGPSSRDRSASREHSFLSNGTEEIEGKTGSGALLESSQTDNPWSNRNLWANHNSVNATRRSSGVSPSRQRASQNTQSFAENSQLPPMQPHTRLGGYPHDTFRSGSLQLDNGTHDYVDKDSGELDTSNEVDRVLGFAAQRSKSMWPGYVESSAMHSPFDDRRSAPNSEYFSSSSATASRNGSLPPSRHGTEPSPYTQTSDFSRLIPAQGTPTRGGHNHALSAHSMQGSQYRTNSFPNDTSNMFDRLSLSANIPNGAGSTHRSSGSNVSMSAYLPQLSNDQKNALGRSNAVDQEQSLGYSGVPSLQSYTPDGLPTHHFADGYGASGPIRFDRGIVTPGSGEVRSSPYYSAAATPPLTNGTLFSHNLNHARNVSNPAYLEQRLRTIAQQDQTGYHPHQYSMFQAQRYPNNLHQYHFQLPNVNTYGGMANTLPIPTMGLPLETPRGPREQDPNYTFRSSVLEEFKNNNKGRRWELKDIMDHIVEFAGDQHGSRFIQSKLETANSDEKEAVYRHLQDNALQLMQDVFGNYVIQKLFEHGDQMQKEALARRMKRRVFDLSKQMYGCRVVQKALEHVLVDQQASLIKELEPAGLVMTLVKDQNGNHVIQKAIECIPAEHIRFIYTTFQGQVGSLAQHTYGCRVIQRMLENCEGPESVWMMQELHACAANLITDQYGNYVAQHIIQHGKTDDRNHVIDLVITNLLRNCKHKFASNVVEKCLIYGTSEQKRAIMREILETAGLGGSRDTTLQHLINDQYGNYVIQSMQDNLDRPEYEMLCDALQPEINKIERVGRGGKQLQAIKKRMHRCDPLSQEPKTTSGASPTQPRLYSTRPSTVTTPPPPLSTDAQSVRSDSIPSTTISAPDEPPTGILPGLDKTSGVVVPQIDEEDSSV